MIIRRIVLAAAVVAGLTFGFAPSYAALAPQAAAVPAVKAGVPGCTGAACGICAACAAKPKPPEVCAEGLCGGAAAAPGAVAPGAAAPARPVRRVPRGPVAAGGGGTALDADNGSPVVGLGLGLAAVGAAAATVLWRRRRVASV